MGGLAGYLILHLGFPSYPWGWYVYLAGLVLDLWTTLWALERGAVEGNPIMALMFRLGPWGPVAFSLLLVVVGGSAAQIGLSGSATIMGFVHLVGGLHNLKLMLVDARLIG